MRLPGFLYKHSFMQATIQIVEELPMAQRSIGYCIALWVVFLLAWPPQVHAVPKKGMGLPPFEATTASGRKVSSTEFAGKVMLLAVSSDDCTYCKMAIPRLNSIQGRYASQGVQVQGLIYGPGFGVEKLKRYIENNEVTFPLALATQKTISDTIGAHSVPTYLLLNKKGTVAGYYRGYSEQNMQEIEKQVKLLLAE
jgi:peroxiredoxin